MKSCKLKYKNLSNQNNLRNLLSAENRIKSSVSKMTSAEEGHLLPLNQRNDRTLTSKVRDYPTQKVGPSSLPLWRLEMDGILAHCIRHVASCMWFTLHVMHVACDSRCMWFTLHVIHAACVTNCMCYKLHVLKLHVLRIAHVVNCTYCELHLLQIALVANCTCCELHV